MEENPNYKDNDICEDPIIKSARNENLVIKNWFYQTVSVIASVQIICFVCPHYNLFVPS
jgi:hypothetical protein